jgi:hypothetical protein
MQQNLDVQLRFSLLDMGRGSEVGALISVAGELLSQLAHDAPGQLAQLVALEWLLAVSFGLDFFVLLRVLYLPWWLGRAHAAKFGCTATILLA